MNWTENEYMAARDMLRAMSDVLRESKVTIQSTPELDRAAMDLALHSAREMTPLPEATRRMVDFLAKHDMIRGNLPENFFERIERGLTLRFERGDAKNERDR